MKPCNPRREGGEKGGRDGIEGGTDGREGCDGNKWVHMAWNGYIMGNQRATFFIATG